MATDENASHKNHISLIIIINMTISKAGKALDAPVLTVDVRAVPVCYQETNPLIGLFYRPSQARCVRNILEHDFAPT